LAPYQSNFYHTGTREFTSSSDLSDILPEEVEAKVKEAAEISMGTEISEDDIKNIQHLCDQVNIYAVTSMLFMK
jgi:RNA processing factor Prp31